MQNKNGIGFLASLLLTILVIVVLGIIVFGSIKASFTGIFESLKKYIGIETPKAEASTKIDECSISSIKRYYWSKDSAKIGEKVNIIIEGSRGCNGKSIRIDIYKDRIFIIGDKFQKSSNPEFKESQINVDWQGNEKGSFYFIPIFGTNKLKKSDVIQIG